MFKKIFPFFFDIIFPKYCCSCGKYGQYICNQCYEELHYHAFPLHLDLPVRCIDEVIASVSFRPPISRLLHDLKYRSVKGIGIYCGQFLYNTTHFPRSDVVTSIPLDKKRFNDRGFNQSEIIAKEFSRVSGIPYIRLLEKNKRVPNQASLSDREVRLHNLSDAFSLLPDISVSESILLIDDVCTTGTTLNECAKILKHHGAKVVSGLVVAHGS